MATSSLRRVIGGLLQSRRWPSILPTSPQDQPAADVHMMRVGPSRGPHDLTNQGDPFHNDGPPEPTLPKDKKPRLNQIGQWIVLPYWSDWTIDQCRAAIDAMDTGLFYDSWLLTYELLRDNRVQDGLRKRNMALRKLPLKVEPAKHPKGKRAAALFKKHLHVIWPAGVLQEVLKQVIFMGFSICKLKWKSIDGQWIPVLVPWQPGLFFYDLLRWLFMANTTEGPQEVIPGNGDWVLFTPDGVILPWMGAVTRQIWQWVILRALAALDWGRVTEMLGKPIRVIKVPMGIRESPDAQKFFDDVVNQGSELVLLAPQLDDGKTGVSLELVEGKQSSWQMFSGLINKAEDEISIGMYGGNLPTKVVGGSLAAIKGQMQGLHDITVNDAMGLTGPLYTQVARLFAHYNFGDAEAAPFIYYDGVLPEDKLELARIQQIEGQIRAQKAKAFGDVANGLKTLNELHIECDAPYVFQQCGILLTRPPMGQDLEVTPLLPPSMETEEEDERENARQEMLAAAGAGAATWPGASRALRAGQTYVDDLMTADDGMPGLEGLVEVVGAATDYDDLRRRLAELLAGWSPEELEKALAQSRMLAENAGRLSVLEEAAET